MKKYKNHLKVIIISFLSSLIFLGNDAFAQKDPVPYRKGNKWTYTKIYGSYDKAHPFFPIYRKAVKKIVVKGENGKPVLVNGKPKMKDSIYYKEIATVAAVKKGEKWGFIKPSGQFLVSPKYDFVKDFGREGFAAVGMSGEMSDQWGFVNHLGKEIVAPKYDGVGDFSEGLASVTKVNLETFKTQFGFVDKTGKLVIPMKEYESVHDFKDGMVAFQNNQRWGFINKKGEVAIPAKFEKVYDFSEGLAKVYKNLKWGFIDKAGRTIIQFKYQDPGDSYGMFQNGLAKVRLNNQEGFIDNKDVARIPIRFIKVGNFSDEDKLAAIKTREGWGFINTKGRVIIKPQPFTSVREFSNGLAAVRQAGKWGFINRTGKVVIQPKYQSIDKDFYRGIAYVQKEGKKFYIDKTGKEYMSN